MPAKYAAPSRRVPLSSTSSVPTAWPDTLHACERVNRPSTETARFEVRPVCGSIDRHGVLDDNLRVESGAPALGSDGRQPSGTRRCGIDERAVRRELKIVPGRNQLESFQGTHLSHEAVPLRADVWPERALAPA